MFANIFLLFLYSLLLHVGLKVRVNLLDETCFPQLSDFGVSRSRSVTILGCHSGGMGLWCSGWLGVLRVSHAMHGRNAKKIQVVQTDI